MEKSKGFSLIELVVAMAILAILAAIAYPMYTGYIARAACDNGKAGLAQADSLMNQYYMKYGKYNGIEAKDFPITSLPIDGSGSTDFTVEVSELTATKYTITATIAGGRLSGYSGTLSINEKGEKEGTGSLANVWQQGCSALAK